MRIDEQLARACENFDRLALELTNTVYAMRDAMKGLPGAQSYDGIKTSGYTTVLDDRGIPVPSVSDPTGEAAIARLVPRGDPASSHHSELVSIIRQAERLSDRALVLAALYQKRQATEKERREADNQSDPGCASCARTEVAKGVQRWMPRQRGDLCRWCYEWQRSTGRMPTLDELVEYHTKGRVRRPA